MNRTAYIVTDVAGPRPTVAGKLCEPGQRIFLSIIEAQHEVSRKVVEEESVREARLKAEAKAEAEAKKDAKPPEPAKSPPDSK